MELLSIRETADLMGAKETTVRTWINRNEFFIDFIEFQPYRNY